LILSGLDRWFAAALAMNIQDTPSPHAFRDNAFWLHFLAAPAPHPRLGGQAVMGQSELIGSI